MLYYAQKTPSKQGQTMIDFKDQNQLYQLIAGLSGFTIILLGCLIIMAPFFPPHSKQSQRITCGRSFRKPKCLDRGCSVNNNY